MDAETMALMMQFFLAGEVLTHPNGPQHTDTLATMGHMDEPTSFLVWNGDDGELFKVTVTKCPDA